MAETEAEAGETGTPTRPGRVGVPSVTAIPPPPALVRTEPTVEDTARRNLAYIFTIIFALTIVFACIAVLVDRNTWPNIKELLPIILPAETALLGSATGFYFGTKH